MGGGGGGRWGCKLCWDELEINLPHEAAIVWNEIDSQRLNCSNRLSIIDYRLSITGVVPDEGQSRGAEQHHYLFIIMNIDLHKR